MQIGTTVHFVVVPLDSPARATVLTRSLRAHHVKYSRTFCALFWLSVFKSQVSPDLHPGPRAGRLGARCASSAFCSLAPGDLAPLAWGLVSPLGAPGHNHIPTPSHSDVMTLRIPSSVLQQPQLDRVFPWEFMQDLSFSPNQTGYGT